MKKNELRRSSKTTESLIKAAVWSAAGVIVEEMMAREGFYQWGIVLSEQNIQSLYRSDKVAVFVTLRGKCPWCVEGLNHWFDKLSQWPQPWIDYLTGLPDMPWGPPNPWEASVSDWISNKQYCQTTTKRHKITTKRYKTQETTTTRMRVNNRWIYKKSLNTWCPTNYIVGSMPCIFWPFSDCLASTVWVYRNRISY